MSCRYNFITDLGLHFSMTSQYFHLKSKFMIFFYVGNFLKFICAYLGICWPIFSQIEICCSWNNTLSVLLLLFFILMTSSWSKIQLKGISPNFASLRVMSRWEFYFPQIMSLHGIVLCDVSCLLLGRFLWNFDML